MSRTALIGMMFLATGGCNSLVGFDLEGGEDAGGGDTKTLIVTRTGDMRGAVTSVPPGINCSPTADNCSHDFPRGSMVTLTATSSPGSMFAGWTGAGCSGTGPCTLTLAIDTSIEARFDDASGGHNFVFVTKQDYTAMMFNPLSNADAICASEAAAVGIGAGRTYKAWLSTSTVDAKDRLGNARGWVRVDGRPVADTVADLTSLKMYYPIRLRADGTRAPMDGARHAVVITGTLNDGTHAPTTCGDWTNSGGMVRVANAQDTGNPWTDWFDGTSCTEQIAFYCFGTDRTAPLTVTPTPGRLAFITRAGWRPGTGIASADTLCQTEATAASFSGTFKAALALTTGSAASRFDTGGAPWVRVDGVPIAAPGMSPFDEVEGPINLWPDGAYSGGSLIATGALTPTTAASATRNCNDWTDGASGVTLNGWSQETTNWFSDINSGPQTFPCTQTFNLYCFQE